MISDIEDRLAIRDLVENWAVWRDAGDWERFQSVWHDDGWMMAHLVSGQGCRLHPRQPRGMGEGRPHSAFPRRHEHRRRRRPRRVADQDDDLAARHRARHCLRRGVYRPLLRLPGEAGRPLGHRAAPADLREGSSRPDRSRRRPSRSTRKSSRNFPRATGTWPTCRRRSAIA